MSREIEDEMWIDALDTLNSITGKQIANIEWIQDPEEKDLCAYKTIIIHLNSPLYTKSKEIRSA